MAYQQIEFTEAEIKGRKKLFDLYLNKILRGQVNITFSEDPGCRHDFLMDKLNGEKIIGEIKNINRPFSKFPNFQIDYDKCEHVLSEGKKQGRTPIVIGFFTDCTMVWDLTDIPFEERRRLVECTATTAVDYGKKKKLKDQTYLYNNEVKKRIVC